MKRTFGKLGLLACMVICVVVPSFAQTGKLRRADQYYEQMLYFKAFPLYQKAYEKDKANNDILRRMAETAYLTGENDLSLRYYKRLITRNRARREDLLGYAKALKKDRNYEEAAFWLAEYNEEGEDSLSHDFQGQLDYISKLYRDSVYCTVSPLKINTKYSELGPLIFGDRLVFCSSGRRTGVVRKSYLDAEPYLKVYSGRILENGQLAQPEIFASRVRSKYHDGPLTIADSMGLMFITQNQKPKGMQLNENKLIQLKIKEARLLMGIWEPTVDFPYNSKKYSVAHPAINESGTTLIFSSNMPGGYGKSDLYVSHWEDGAWSKPVNLGPEINTAGTELFPDQVNDSVLYFSSDYHEGLGGLDIIRAEFKYDGSVDITNPGAPINSSFDDFSTALLEGEYKGYFASNRSGNDDIYFYEKKNIPIPVRILVSDHESESPVELAEVYVLNELGDTVAHSLTDRQGELDLDLVNGDSYRMLVRKRNYFSYEQDFVCTELSPNLTPKYEVALQYDPSTPGDGVRPIYMDMEDGEPIQILEIFAIHYELAQWKIKPKNFDILNPVIDYLAANPDLELRIESHADSRGSREFNDRLSNKRAVIVNNYFVSRYIRPERLKYKGFGESRLLNICYDKIPCSEEEHAVNRRTIIKIVRKGDYHNMRLRRSAFYF